MAGAHAAAAKSVMETTLPTRTVREVRLACLDAASACIYVALPCHSFTAKTGALMRLHISLTGSVTRLPQRSPEDASA